MIELDPLYVAARRVLLDALTALSDHRDALIVAGAQAVYLHTGEGELAVAPFTTDADLALDPRRLAPQPDLASAMRAAGFELAQPGGHVEPGIWIAETQVGARRVTVPVDLIVPAALAPPAGRRGARLPAHGNQAARKTVGLEAALVDHAPQAIGALEPDDERRIETNVAGVAALLVAKAHKLHDRAETRQAARLDAKDAADVLRLMQTADPSEVRKTMRRLAADSVAGEVSAQALLHLDALFGRRGRPGIELAAQALRLAMPRARVEAIAVNFMNTMRGEEKSADANAT